MNYIMRIHSPHRSIPALLAVTALLAFSACKKDKDDVLTPSTPPANEEEVITTVQLTFTDQETSTEVFHMSFNANDGGSGGPVVVADVIPTQRAFDVTVRFLNESVSPAVDLTSEVLAEGTEHQVFFQVTNGNLSMAYADADANGKPIGLGNTAISGAASTGGELRVILRHQPDKNATGVASGDITNAGGETDVEVVFPLTIQ